MTKILFTDMDGTLLLSNSTISTEMKIALEKLHAAGHILVLSSGRPLDSILEVAEAEGILPDQAPAAGKENCPCSESTKDAEIHPGSTLIISNNGSLVYDCTARKPVMEQTVPFHIAADIFAAAKRLGIHVQTYTDHEIVCEKDDAEVQFYRSRVHMPLITSSDELSVLSRPPYKVHTIHLTDKSKLDALKAEIESLHGDTITVQFSNDQFLEFYNKHAGKGNAVRWVSEHFGIPLSDCFAAGDAPNDISMLIAAGTGIAMANADSEVKEIADVITEKDNDHNGLIEMIERYFI